jgi:hypothetical protein
MSKCIILKACCASVFVARSAGSERYAAGGGGDAAAAEAADGNTRGRLTADGGGIARTTSILALCTCRRV